MGSSDFTPYQFWPSFPLKFPVTTEKGKKGVFSLFCCCYHYFQLFANKKGESIILLKEGGGNIDK
jgi:hypothetical protein